MTKIKTCPYCQAKIKSNANIVVCDSCNTPHHEECWGENKGCTAYGCSNNPNINPKEGIIFESIDVGNQTVDDIQRQLEIGREKPKETINCPKCNILIDKNSEFCKHCGQFLKEDVSMLEKERFEKEYKKRYKEKVYFGRKRFIITSVSIVTLILLFIFTFYYSYKMINEYFASEKYQEQSEIEEFISNWEKAWESKDINRYKVLLDEDYIYYDKDGTAVDLEDKIKRIKYTFDNYKYIEIDIEEIKTEKNPETPDYINVTFTQNYKSDKFEQTGVKTLRLYKVKGTRNKWKIFREYYEGTE